MLLSILFFILAGLAEIGGGYLVWLYMRDDKGPLYLIAGAIILCLYGIIPTFQPEASFHRSSFDLHVLSTPPAFVLSQDQTLQDILKLFE